mgnify:CR=1 FL=1
MVGNTELVATSFALLIVPFLVYGAIWLMGRLAVSDGGTAERAVPPTHERPSRVIPGTRSEEAD